MRIIIHMLCQTTYYREAGKKWEVIRWIKVGDPSLPLYRARQAGWKVLLDSSEASALYVNILR